MRGFYNRVLKVEMIGRSFEVETVPGDVMQKFLGGKGLGTCVLLKHNSAGVDPPSKGNRLIFSIKAKTPFPAKHG